MCFTLAPHRTSLSVNPKGPLLTKEHRERQGDALVEQEGDGLYSGPRISLHSVDRTL